MRQSRGIAASSGRKSGFRDIGRIVTQSVSAWLEHSASSMGAALAFYTLFSVAPILIICLAIAGYLFGPHTAETELLAQLQALTGDAGAAALRNLLDSARYSEKKGWAAAIGLITLLIGAMSVFSELQHALEQIWGTPPHKREAAWWEFLRARMLSLETRVLALRIVLPLLDLALSFAMTVVLFAMIYKYVPRERIAWRDVWIGAAVTAFLFAIGKLLIGAYLGRSSFSSAYGAAGSLIVLLLWIYYSAQIFLLGAEFTCVFAYAHGSRISQRPRVRRDLDAAAD
jgi:membrane protein